MSPSGLYCIGCFLLVYYAHALPYQLIAEEITYFKKVSLPQFDNFGDVEGFSHSAPADTAFVIWSFFGNKSSNKCANKLIHIHIRYGSFPLVQENNQTFPRGFVLNSTESRQLNLTPNGTVSQVVLQNPLQGTWYAAAYVDKTQSESVGKLTDAECSYLLQVNVTRYPLVSIPVISLHRHSKGTFTGKTLFYKFFVEEDVWQYSVQVIDCHYDNTSLVPCPVDIFVRGCALPDYSNKTQTVNCSASKEDCSLTVGSPSVHCWHYIVLQNQIESEIDVSLKLNHEVCEPSVSIKSNHRNPRDVVLSQDVMEPGSNGTDDSDIHFKPIVPAQSKHCNAVLKLDRFENANYPMLSDFILQTSGGGGTLNVTEGKVSIIKFEISPVKDIGSTLVILLEAHLIQFFLKPPSQNITMTTCIQRGSIPIDGAQLKCTGDERTLESNLADNSNPAFIAHFPYPEPGLWFIAVQEQCFNSSTGAQEPCLWKSTLAEFQVFTAPCNEGSCDNQGSCRQVLQGGVLQSFCHCIAKYRGFTCGDDSEASSKPLQLLYMLLLTLSNLAFLPAIVLATYRHYYTEALVYFANMFFSTFYHACDQDPFSLYKLCILPYHPLQYADFFCSILSFWATLLVVSAIQQPWRSLLEMLGAVVMAIVVEWQTHNVIVNVVPICIGVAIVILSWTIRSIRTKQCFPGKQRLLCFFPGVSLAGIGLAVFNFLETDDNYAITHSAWHICVATSIIFLLPKKTIQVIEEPISDAYELGGSDQRALLQSINASDPDDLIL